MSTILILGKNGQVATYLQQVFSQSSSIRSNTDVEKPYQIVVAGSDVLDLRSTELIYGALERYAPEIIINTAAYTAVDAAETDQVQAYAINRDAVSEIARYCENTDTPLIHYSTDYVFSGDSEQAYSEDDIVEPNGVYGKSKLQGEQAIQQSGAPAIILRTAWVYSNQGKNFYKTMLALSEQRDTLSVVNDQIGSPTYAGSIASATKQIVDIVLDQKGLTTAQQGVFHFSCQGQTSWADFAKAIFVENEVTHMSVNGIPSTEYPTPVKRPAFSVLNTQKLLEAFGVSLPHWGTALSQCAAETKIQLNASRNID